MIDAIEIKRKVEATIERERNQYDRAIEEIDSNQILKCFHSNEDGDARLFSMLHKNRFIYDHGSQRWYVWHGHFWKEDLTNQAMAGINNVIECYAAEAKLRAWAAVKAEKAGKSDEAKKEVKLQEDLLKRIRTLQGAQRKRNVLFLATVGQGLTGDEWDRNPWLLGCQNGVIDLRSGEHRQGQTEDYIKTVAPTNWKGLEEPCPTWQRFLSDIFESDAELISYVQSLFGYGITGMTILHIIAILHGAGRNGKGTLLETLKYILGDLAYKAEAELLLEQKFNRQSGAPNSGVLSLRGKRLVWCSETEEGRRFNTSRVKELVGGDTLNARAPYAPRHVEFLPSHLLMLLTNNKPAASAGDYALWQRIHLIPFKISFVDKPILSHESKADPNLLAKLKTEASGILAWLVLGCLKWQSQGLIPPKMVQTATKEYQADEDIIGHFIEDVCIVSDRVQVQAGELYKAYREWCDDNGHNQLSGTRFGKEIKRRFDCYKTNYVFYKGIGLKLN